MRPDNTQTSVEIGDSDGEKRTLFFYDLEDESELKTRAKEEILKYKYSGYKGSLPTLLKPFCRVGNVAKVIDPNFPERDGNYLIEKTRVSYGSGGGRRVVCTRYQSECMSDLKEALNEFVKDRQTKTIFPAKVLAVNETAFTCDVQDCGRKRLSGCNATGGYHWGK